MFHVHMYINIQLLISIQYIIVELTKLKITTVLTAKRQYCSTFREKKKEDNITVLVKYYDLVQNINS